MIKYSKAFDIVAEISSEDFNQYETRQLAVDFYLINIMG